MQPCPAVQIDQTRARPRTDLQNADCNAEGRQFPSPAGHQCLGTASLPAEETVGLKGESEESLAKAFIAEIRAMNARMDIPDHFNCIRKEDIPLMATWAAQEANPVYPVPVIYDEARFARVIERSHHSQ